MTDYQPQPAVIWARQNLDAGVHAEAVVKALIGQGWTELAARQVLDQALSGDSSAIAVLPSAPPIRVQARPRVVGYASSVQTDPYRAAAASAHLRNMRNGAILLGVGLAITIGTMSLGGVTLLAWGPILYGGIRLISGFFGWIGSR